MNAQIDSSILSLVVRARRSVKSSYLVSVAALLATVAIGRIFGLNGLLPASIGSVTLMMVMGSRTDRLRKRLCVELLRSGNIDLADKSIILGVRHRDKMSAGSLVRRFGPWAVILATMLGMIGVISYILFEQGEAYATHITVFLFAVSVLCPCGVIIPSRMRLGSTENEILELSRSIDLDNPRASV